MASIKAKVVQWNEERGFGFATSDGTRYFVHKTALGWTERAPRVGDVITIYQRGNGPKGPRIEKGCLDGVPVRTYAKTETRGRRTLRAYLILALFVGVIIFPASYLAKRLPNGGAIVQSTSQQEQYTTRDAVARYICDNGRLPPNYVDKATGTAMYERKTGRSFRKWNFNPWTTLGVMIGGDRFENRKGLLPGDYYREADVDYFGDNRGTNRLVYADGCEIWYTADHYQSFSQMNLADF
ncbi:MAG: hypothetical protein J6Y56_03775 [Fibrobacterales bacterium]|nr:hypothetical protein [Fibrobacterales bacterium]